MMSAHVLSHSHPLSNDECSRALSLSSSLPMMLACSLSLILSPDGECSRALSLSSSLQMVSSLVLSLSPSAHLEQRAHARVMSSSSFETWNAMVKDSTLKVVHRAIAWGKTQV
eukprot:3410869-Rhodomonas_salina.2